MYGPELPSLRAEYSTGEQFLAGTDVEDGLARFSFVPENGQSLPALANIGQLLSVNLRFGDSGIEFHVHARVIARDDKEGGRLLLEFLRGERLRQELVLAAARGESVGYRRRRVPRLDVRLPARARGKQGRWREATASSLSARGLHLDLWPSPEIDQLLRISLRFPGRLRAVEIWARVASLIETGPQRGVGVEFVFRSPEQRELVAELVHDLEQRQT